MPIPDYADTVQTALVEADFPAVLEVDDDWRAVEGAPLLLVADDGGNPVLPGPWMVGYSPRRTSLRLTAFAHGRSEARETVVDAAEFVRVNRPGIARIEDIPPPLITRDRETGAYLASITVPVIVRQTA